MARLRYWRYDQYELSLIHICFTVVNHGQGLDSAKLRKHPAKFVFCGLKRQVTYVNLFGQLLLSL